MDSLIVLRKPLRKSHLAPKFVIPKKPKKAVPKVDPIPPEPDLEEGSTKPPISFVKLYKELCLQQGPKPPAALVYTPASRAWDSDGSLATTAPYRGRHRAARAELVLELDYGTTFEDCGFS